MQSPKVYGGERTHSLSTRKRIAWAAHDDHELIWE